MTSVASPADPWLVQADTPPLEAALAYARAGFRVVWINGVVINPETQKSFCTCKNAKCPPNHHGKHPVFTAWQREASTDPEVLRDQFSRLRFTPNVGIVLGDGHISIDVDSHERLTELEANLGALPLTLTGRSARGARLFFKAPSDKIRNASALGDKPGVDVKSKGGQVVVAPSLHASGARYSWDYPLASVAELPEAWVLFLLPKRAVPAQFEGYTPSTLKLDAEVKRKADKYLQRAVHEECSLLARVGEGGRNSSLHTVLCRLLPLAHGLSLLSGHSYVIGECTKAAMNTGLGQREIATTIASVEKWMAETGAIRMPRIAAEPAPRKEAPLHEPNAISLTLDQSRKPAKIPSNVAEVLQRDPEWRGGPMRDQLSMLTVWPMPIPDPVASHQRVDRELVDADYDAIQEFCHRVHDLRVGTESVQRGVRLAVTRAKPYDSLIEHSKSLPRWDGTRRLRTWAAKYLGCPEDRYHEHMGAAWLASVMHRAVVPGEVVDLVAVLMGRQKAGKNRAVEVLFSGGPKSAPFLAPLGSWKPDHADTKRLACSRWVLHDDEFSARDERTVDSLKSWVSRDSEQWTPKYSNDVVIGMRRAVLVVSVNSDAPLKDATGARRFGPLKIGEIDLDGLAKVRDQLLAEALTLHDQWRAMLPTDAEHEQATDEATEEDGLESAILRISDWPAHGLSVSEIGERCGMRSKELTRTEATRLGLAAKRVHCRSVRVERNGVRMRFYLRPT